MPIDKVSNIQPQRKIEPYQWLPDHPVDGAPADVAAYARAVRYASMCFTVGDCVRKAGLDPARWAETERQATRDRDQGLTRSPCALLVERLHVAASEAELSILERIQTGQPKDLHALLKAIRPDDYNPDMTAVRRDVIAHVLDVARGCLDPAAYQALARELAAERGPGERTARRGRVGT